MTTQGGQVLIVEDDQDVSDAVTDSLRDAGYGVTATVNGTLAIGALQASDDLPGLILLDLMMPEMDGAEFLQEIKKDPRLAGLPVVLMTADGHAHKKATAMGADAGLRKPVQLKDLLATVAKYCHRR